MVEEACTWRTARPTQRLLWLAVRQARECVKVPVKAEEIALLIRGSAWCARRERHRAQ